MYKPLQSISLRLFLQTAFILATFLTVQACEDSAVKRTSEDPVVKKIADDFIIKGTAEGFPDQTVTLTAQTGVKNGESDRLASTNLVDGQFEFKGQLKQAPIRIHIEFSDKRFLLDMRNNIFIEASEMSLSLKFRDKPTELKEKGGYFIDLDELKGSSSHDEYTQLQNDLAQFDKRQTAIRSASRTRKLNEKDDAAVKKIDQEKYNYLTQLIEENSDQFKSLFALNKMLFSKTISWEKKKTLFASLSKRLQNSVLGIEYIKEATHFEQSEKAEASSVASTASGNFVIKGTAEGFPDQTVTLTAQTGVKNGENNRLASASLVDGQFEFKGQLKQAPIRIHIKFSDKRFLLDMRNSIFVEASEMSLSLKFRDKPTELKEKGGYFIDLDELKGSSSHDEYTQLQNDLTQFDKRQTAIRSASRTRKLNEKDEAAVKKIEQEKHNHLIDLIYKYPNRFKSLFALNEILYSERMNWEEKKELFSLLSKTLQNSPLGTECIATITRNAHREKMAAEVVEGKTFKDFTLNDVNGKSVKMSQSLKPESYVLLNFWVSWDKHSRAENLNTLSAYKKYQDKGFNVVSVSLDEERSDWLKAIEEDGVASWTHLSDLKSFNSELVTQYAIRDFTQSFLLDENGKIIATNLNGEALHKKLAELLD